MTEPLAFLRACGLRHGYRGARGRYLPVVAGVDLAVARGEIVGICGPSGAGKSTLLRLLGGIEPPAGGAMFLDGQRMWSAGSRPHRLVRRGAVMAVFQDPVGSLDQRWPLWRSVTEPLLARSRSQRPGRNERRALGREWLGRVGLAGIDPHARPRAVSVGQCQRACIARALVARPDVLIADEPTAALDLTTTALVLRLLRDAADSGLVIVVVSHDERMLSVLCDRVMALRAP